MTFIYLLLKSRVFAFENFVAKTNFNTKQESKPYHLGDIATTISIWGINIMHWCLRTMVLEKTLESPLDCKEIQPVNPKGNQLWIFIGKTDAEAETPIFWPPDAKHRLTGKDPDAGKDWGQEEKGGDRG